MNDEELKKVKTAIALTWAYYRHDEIPPTVLKMYVSDLRSFDPEKICFAYNKWRLDPKNRSMPLPSDIVGMITEQLSESAAANEAASRVVGAVSKYGKYRGKEAREWIGELGWEAMSRMFGGWSTICTELTIRQTPMVNAQLRELCKSMLEARMKGVNERGPSLPEPAMPQVESQKSLSDLSDMMDKFRNLDKK